MYVAVVGVVVGPRVHAVAWISFLCPVLVALAPSSLDGALEGQLLRSGWCC